MEDYYHAVKYLESLGNIAGGYQKTNLASHPNPAIFLERMQDFLDLIGNPEKNFKYIHITGTSGKGSVSALTQAMLVKARKKTGLFTSPFVVSTIEKIQVNNEYIDPRAFARITDVLKPFIDRSILSGRHGVPSYFELILAIALIYFKEQKCEYVVLEVGLGGRYDATNIVKHPLVTVITTIRLDHMNILGPTRKAIAQDKMGIIKKGSNFFTTETDPYILKMFQKTCLSVGASFKLLKVDGLGHREKNKLLASSIVSFLGIKSSHIDINLPARFEVIPEHPLVIIDGAHNPSKIESVLENLKTISFKKLHVIFACSADKDWKAMLGLIAPVSHTLYITRFNVVGRHAVDPAVALSEAQKYVKDPKNLKLYSDPLQAFTDIKKNAEKSDAVLIVGSFYLAGEIRALYCPESKILKQRNSRI